VEQEGPIVPAQSLDGWLSDLASGEPTPGGGAAAAMNAAIGAALIEMVCNLTIGRPRFAAHARAMTVARDEAAGLRKAALDLAAADAVAFGAVSAAYRLPKETAAQREQRAARVQDALAGAAEVPLEVAARAAELIQLASAILDLANPTVISDVAVAASSAQAALEAAVVNVEVNLAGLDDSERRDELTERLLPLGDAALLAEATVRTVRDRLGD
jgi:formiminotetrahydrofolate cyclodeaminase